MRRKLGCGNLGNDADDKLYIEHVKKSLSADHRNGFRLPSSEDTTKQCRDNAEGLPVHDDERLDIGLLPPISTMTSLQKRMVQRQLELQVQARMHARKRVRVQA